MKVLMISHSCVAAENQKKVEAIAKDKSLEVTLLVPTVWREPLRDIPLEKSEDERYRVVASRVSFNGRIGGYFYPLWTVLKLLGNGFDIVQIEEEPFSLVALQFIMFKSLFKKTRFILFTWENIYIERLLVRDILEKFVLNRIDYLISGSRDGDQIMKKKGYAGRSSVLPLMGVDVESVDRVKAERLRTSLGLPGFFVVGFVGRLVKEKGVLILIEALKGIEPPFKCLIVGRGPLKEEILSAVSTAGFKDRFLFVDTVPHHEVCFYISLMNCLVLPSITTPLWREQFGHVLIEAMACGVPVIGSNSGGIPDVIGDAGMIFKEGDAIGLKENINALIHRGELSALYSKKGRERVLDNYTHEKIAEKTIKIWKETIPKKILC